MKRICTTLTLILLLSAIVIAQPAQILGMSAERFLKLEEQNRNQYDIKYQNGDISIIRRTYNNLNIFELERDDVEVSNSYYVSDGIIVRIETKYNNATLEEVSKIYDIRYEKKDGIYIDHKNNCSYKLELTYDGYPSVEYTNSSKIGKEKGSAQTELPLVTNMVDSNMYEEIEESYSVDTTKLGGPKNALLSIMMPGLGRHYVDGRRQYPWAISASAVASLTTGIVFKLKSNDSYNVYKNLPYGTPQSEFDKQFNEADQYNQNSMIFFGVASAIWLYDIIWTTVRGTKNKKEKNRLQENLSIYPVSIGNKEIGIGIALKL